MASTLSAGLQLGSDLTAKISPLVPTLILDYLRSKSDKKGYILGKLLGYREGDTIHVKNCYGVPYEVTETMDEIAGAKVEIKYNPDHDERMRKLLTRGTKEEVVGAFYVATGQLKNGPETQGFWSYWQAVLKKDRKSSPILLGIDPKYKAGESLNMRVHREHNYGLSEI